MKNVAAFVVLALFVTGASAQTGSVVPAQTTTVPKTANRPKLALQDALKLAEVFTATKQIDLSHYWLYRGSFILFGDPGTADKDKIPGWYFWWVNDSGALGDYVEIFVSMDGECRRLPSM